MTRITKKAIADAKRIANRKQKALAAFEEGMNVALEDLRPYATAESREKRDVMYAAHGILRQQAIRAGHRAERIQKEYDAQ